MYDYFSTFINITQIRLYTMYFYSTGGAAALLSNYAATVSETMALAEFELSERAGALKMQDWKVTDQIAGV